MLGITFGMSLTLTLMACSIGGLASKTKNEGTTVAPTSAVPKPANDNSKMADDAKSMTSQEKDSRESDDLDLMSIMAMCNESFRIDMAFLVSLNESGSFPDETDKTPKCYLRCMLQSTKVASLDDGAIDAERAALVFSGTRDGGTMDDVLEMTTYCAQNRDETCKCEMAYNFLKCLFSMEIEKHSNKS